MESATSDDDAGRGRASSSGRGFDSSAWRRRRRAARRASPPAVVAVLGAALALALVLALAGLHRPLGVRAMGTEEARLYDRNLVHFSPEGRLYQVQYAERAAQRGSPVLALSNGRDALALCCERRRASRLEDFAALEKLGSVQPPPPPPPPSPQVGAKGPAAPSLHSSACCAYLGFAGLAADGRRLLDRTRLFAENYRLRHGEAPGVREMALFIADTQHRNTFVRAHRPYGVACVLAGFDDEDEAEAQEAKEAEPSAGTDSSDSHGLGRGLGLRPRIFATGPSGAVQEHVAVCVGEHAEPVTARVAAHRRELPRMTGRQLARFGARLLLDARGSVPGAGAGAGEEDEDEEKTRKEEEEEGPGYEVEVVVLRRRRGEGDDGSGWVQARRVLLAGRQDLERAFGDETGGGEQEEDAWFEGGQRG